MPENDHRWRDERWRDERRDENSRDFYGRDEYRSGYYGGRGREDDRYDRDRGRSHHGQRERDSGYGAGGSGGYGYESLGRDDFSRGSRDRYGSDFDAPRGGGSEGHDRDNPYAGMGTADDHRYRDDRASTSGSYRPGSGRPEQGRSSYGQGPGGFRSRGWGLGLDETDQWPEVRREHESRGYANQGRDSRSPRGEDRGFWDRASDEVASWFGDEDAERRRRQDARHSGRGPRDYRRSDDRIREDINDRLTEDPYIDASDITVRVENGEVTLHGTVENRHSRRRAEDVAEQVSGVTHVQNNTRVRSRDEGTQAIGSVEGRAATMTDATGATSVLSGSGAMTTTAGTGSSAEASAAGMTPVRGGRSSSK